MKSHTAFYRPPEIFVVDRTISITDSLVWMAITSANQIKFETVVKQLDIKPAQPESERLFVNFIAKTPTTADLLYGIRFSLSVLNFTLKITSETGSSTILDFTGTSHAIKEIRFKTPVPIIPTFKFVMTYTSNPRDTPREVDDIKMFTQYEVLNPILTLGILNDAGRHELHDSLLRENFEPIDDDDSPPQTIEDIEKTKPTSIKTTSYLPLNITPIVILRNGSTYDRNLVTINIQEL